MNEQDQAKALEVRRQHNAWALENARVSVEQKRLAHVEAVLDEMGRVVAQMNQPEFVFGGQDFSMQQTPRPSGNSQKALAAALEILNRVARDMLGEHVPGKAGAQVSETFNQNILVLAQQLGLDPNALEHEARLLLGEGS